MASKQLDFYDTVKPGINFNFILEICYQLRTIIEIRKEGLYLRSKTFARNLKHLCLEGLCLSVVLEKLTCLFTVINLNKLPFRFPLSLFSSRIYCFRNSKFEKYFPFILYLKFLFQKVRTKTQENSRPQKLVELIYQNLKWLELCHFKG